MSEGAGYSPRDNSGSLFENHEKKTDKHPDYKGSVRVNGVDFWVSAWDKTSKTGKQFISLSVTPKQPASEDEARRGAAGSQEDAAPY